MFAFGLMLGFFGMCTALDPNRIRKNDSKSELRQDLTYTPYMEYETHYDIFTV